ncbi:MAG: hypothetical protein HY695_02730 [Deltaproteobacteria bacterium]|nr:hypothetical protein [Deltaproteobacteria bacterium]
MIDRSRGLLTKPGLYCLLVISFVFVSIPTELIRAAASPEKTEGFAQEKTVQGIRYITGGVSLEERKSMAARARGYNLRLTFTGKAGRYLGDVKLLIQDETGKEILNTNADGPWFYIDLPPGKYTTKASFKGETKEIKNLLLTKGKSLQKSFQWQVE